MAVTRVLEPSGWLAAHGQGPDGKLNQRTSGFPFQLTVLLSTCGSETWRCCNDNPVVDRWVSYWLCFR